MQLQEEIPELVSLHLSCQGCRTRSSLTRHRPGGLQLQCSPCDILQTPYMAQDPRHQSRITARQGIRQDRHIVPSCNPIPPVSGHTPFRHNYFTCNWPGIVYIDVNRPIDVLGGRSRSSRIDAVSRQRFIRKWGHFDDKNHPFGNLWRTDINRVDHSGRHPVRGRRAVLRTARIRNFRRYCCNRGLMASLPPYHA